MEGQTQHYKVTDIDDNVFTLIEKSADGIKAYERNKARRQVNVRDLESFNTSDFTGPVVKIGADEFAKILQEDWSFDNVETEEGQNDDESDADTAAVQTAGTPAEEGFSETDAATEAPCGESDDGSADVDDAPADGQPVATDEDGVDGTVEGSDDGNADDAGTDDEAASDEPSDYAVSGDEPSDDEGVEEDELTNS